MPDTTLYVPVGPLTAGVPLPSWCPRHGRPAVGTRAMTFESRIHPAAYLLLLVALLPALIVMMVMVRRVKAPAVPVCQQCLDDRRLRVSVAAALLLPAAVTFFAPFYSGVDIVPAFVGSLLIAFAAAALAITSGWGALMRGKYDGDAFVVLKRPGDAFARAYTQLASAGPPVG